MYAPDTIAAIATPAGAGGIAVVRVSGPDAARVGRAVFRALPEPAESHRLYAGAIVDADGATIDRGLCVLMKAPHSYTGEEVVEIHGHGGSMVARAVLAATLAAGARAAERGEFTKRAFLNGRLDLAQAESVADLIASRTPAAMRAAAAQLAGELSSEVERLRDAIVAVTARLEVAIDFSEEDVGEIDRDELGAEARAIRDRALGLAATFRRGRIVREGARVAIVGRPNVGKSSLLNRLVHSDRAIVTAVPGTTRDVIEEGVDLGGIPVVFVDTAGLRESSDEIERIGIERTHSAVATADLALVILDGSDPLCEEDLRVFDATSHNLRIIVINKEDLPLEIDVEELASRFGVEPRVSISARTGSGLEDLCECIGEQLAAHAPADAGAVLVTRERHHRALCDASASLEQVLDSLSESAPPDLIAVDLMAALDHLGTIVGRTTPEDVLDRIFSEFCIGK